MCAYLTSNASQMIYFRYLCFLYLLCSFLFAGLCVAISPPGCDEHTLMCLNVTDNFVLHQILLDHCYSNLPLLLLSCYISLVLLRMMKTSLLVSSLQKGEE